MDGEFGFGIPISGAFKTAGKGPLPIFDNFLLLILFPRLQLRKQSDLEITIDVVGYSDDKILNITNASGGFLQNTEGTGTIPTTTETYLLM